MRFQRHITPLKEIPPMNSFTPMVRLISVAGFASVVLGCGSVPETTSETQEANAPVSVTARLEYQIDSLANENRRLRQQIEVLGAENRNLTAHSAELETKLSETPATPRVEPATAPVSAGVAYEKAVAAFRNRNFTTAIQGLQSL